MSSTTTMANSTSAMSGSQRRPGSVERSQRGASTAVATASRRVGTTAIARTRRANRRSGPGTTLTRSLGNANAREQRAEHVVGTASLHLELGREADPVAQHGGRDALHVVRR